MLDRRTFVKGTAATLIAGGLASPSTAVAGRTNPRWEEATRRGLDWLARQQSNLGSWTADVYPTALAALAGTALACSGSTTTEGPYARNISLAADYLLTMSRDNGLIGDPLRDSRYTYGHGFSMLFLSQVLGEEGLKQRRVELIDVLTRAAEFSGNAQTTDGGWGYLSAKDDANFDEGSTTITQVQGLRGCRNAAIPVSADVIERAKQYIYRCQNNDGGISYSIKNMGQSRPAITAAALAALYNAGAYEDPHIPPMLKYSKENLNDIGDQTKSFGNWHYAYLYYSQVMYRQGEAEWAPFRDRLMDRLVNEQSADGYWQGNIHPVFITACNLIMLQLDLAYLPIYQR
jgi:squalene cyclase